MKNKETPMTPSEKLRFLTAGKSRREIEIAAGLKAGDIGSYINRDYLPPPSKLLRLCKVLKVSMSWLCDPTRGIVIPDDALTHAA